MKILILGDPHGKGDEGARNVSKNVCKLLSEGNDVLCIPATKIPTSIPRVMKFGPDIIHSLHGPVPRTLYLLAVLHLVCPRATIFASLTQPDNAFFKNSQPLWRHFKFIHLLSQDIEVEERFKTYGFKVLPVPNGVDTARFRPVDPRLPFSLSGSQVKNDRLILHIGHIKKNRGLDILADINKVPGWHSVIVGSTRFSAEPDVLAVLKDSGCTIYQGFIDDLAALYNSVDAYIFPVSAKDGSIDTPLTVLEALACGCPVISTPYKALPRFIQPGTGLFYFDDAGEAINCLDKVTGLSRQTVRNNVEALSWKRVIDELIDIYRQHVKFNER